MRRAELIDFVRQRGLAVVATTSGTGAPEAAVVGITATDLGELVLDTAVDSRKADNIRRDPRVAVVIGWDDEQTLQIEGIADFLTGDERDRCSASTSVSTRTDGTARRIPNICHVRINPSWGRHSDYRPESFGINEFRSLSDRGMPDAVLLVNPGAGSGRGMSFAVTAAAALRRAGTSVDVRIGRSAEHRSGLHASRSPSRLSTLSSAAVTVSSTRRYQAVARSDTALGIIPAGTGNDVARALALPLGDPAAAAAGDHVRNEHRDSSISAGSATDGSLPCSPSGFDSRVNDRANRLRWPHGKARYHAAVALELPNSDRSRSRLTLDDRRHRDRRHARRRRQRRKYGGGMRICPAAALTDATFDVTVVTASAPSSCCVCSRPSIRGRHVDRPEVLTFRAAGCRSRRPSVTGTPTVSG